MTDELSLEQQADQLLADDRANRRAEDTEAEDFGILLPEQLRRRQQREVYAKSGHVDPAVESGIFSRAQTRTRKRTQHGDG
jgi:hypothetical protein